MVKSITPHRVTTHPGLSRTFPIWKLKVPHAGNPLCAGKLEQDRTVDQPTTHTILQNKELLLAADLTLMPLKPATNEEPGLRNTYGSRRHTCSRGKEPGAPYITTMHTEWTCIPAECALDWLPHLPFRKEYLKCLKQEFSAHQVTSYPCYNLHCIRSLLISFFSFW